MTYKSPNELQYTIRMYDGCGRAFIPGVFCTRDSEHDGRCGLPVGEQRVQCPHQDHPTQDVCRVCQEYWDEEECEFTFAVRYLALIVLAIALVLGSYFYG